MPVLMIMGATATGKSALAMQVAAGRSLISADSRQVYRGLRIGTAQPTSAEREEVEHHLVDFLPLEQRYSAQRFCDDALALLVSLQPTPIIVGGTGFYMRSLIEGLFSLDVEEDVLLGIRAELDLLETSELNRLLGTMDSASAERIHENDRRRIVRALEVVIATQVPLSEHHKRERERPADFQWRKVWVRRDRGELHERIAARTRAMLAGGWREEVKSLLAEGADPGSYGMQTMGYPQVLDLLAGELSEEEAAEQIIVRTRQYARRQEIWFGKERDTLVVDAAAEKQAIDSLRRLLAP